MFLLRQARKQLPLITISLKKSVFSTVFSQRYEEMNVKNKEVVSESWAVFQDYKKILKKKIKKSCTPRLLTIFSPSVDDHRIHMVLEIYQNKRFGDISRNYLENI